MPHPCAEHDLCVLMEALIEYEVVDGVIDADSYDLVLDDRSFVKCGQPFCNTCDDYIIDAVINDKWEIILPSKEK